MGRNDGRGHGPRHRPGHGALDGHGPRTLDGGLVMKLVNEFIVHATLSVSWPVMLDIPRVVGCITGATVENSDGDRYRGTVTAKIGPITATYSGTAYIRETDVDEHAMVLALDAS